MKKVLSICMLALFASACGSASVAGLAQRTQGRSIAVVSLSVNDYMRSLQGWNDMRTSDLMTSNAAGMVGELERQLSARWRVVPAPTFVGRLAPFTGAPFDVATPSFPEGAMPVLAGSRPALVRAELSVDQARALAQVTGADLVAVVYSEWGVKTGSMVPTSKALAKNVLSIYDATGVQVYHGRADVMGDKTLGAFSRVVVDENTVGQWLGAYAAGIARLLGG